MGLTGILLAGGKSRRLNFNKIEVRIDKIPLFIDQIFKLSFFCDEILISASDNNYKFIKNELIRIEDYYNHYYHLCNLSKIPSVKIIKDKAQQDNSFKSMGPISGIKNGLEYAKNLYSLVIAFDMPFISYNLLYLLEEIRSSQRKSKDAFIIKTEKGFEALCGIYSKNCLNVIKKNIEKKIYKISEIFHNIDARFILLNKLNIKTDINKLYFYKLNNRTIDSFNFFNINTVDDYNYFNKIWDLQIFPYQGFSKQVIPNSTGDSTNLFCEKWKYFFYRR
ncbi:MAG: molybdenum cofactor guanylyltransferase [Candidatus Humimicrobiaceae bacterium]